MNNEGYKVKITNARASYEKRLSDLEARRDQMHDSYDDLIEMTAQECDAWHNELNRIVHKIHQMKKNIKEYGWRC